MEEQERIVKGIWIPIDIWKDKNLSWNEKLLYLEIDSFDFFPIWVVGVIVPSCSRRSLPL